MRKKTVAVKRLLHFSCAFSVFCILIKCTLPQGKVFAYVTKCCEVSQGKEMKNPSIWQEESVVVPKSDMFSKWRQFNNTLYLERVARNSCNN